MTMMKTGFASALCVVLGSLWFVAACGKKAENTAPTTPEPAATADAGVAEVAPPPDDSTTKLNDAQCGEVFDKIVSLMEADKEEKPYVKSFKGEHDKFIANCLENANKKDYDCFLAAKTIAEKDACSGK
jgi:hypothetical protein